MLIREDRFYAPSGGIYPGGPSFWHIVDWDQRRLVTVKMDRELDCPDPAFDNLLKHIDTLPPDVYLIHVTDDGELLSSSTDPKDDETRCPFRPALEQLENPADIKVICRTDLQEMTRLGPMVDLVVTEDKPERQLVFKYYFMFQHLSFNWHEASLHSRLNHPNIVPFDKIVVDEVRGYFVGFTMKFIPGGTLDENTGRIFKLKWLHQLIGVVDELNLNLGVVHQDIAPRNILIDEETDSLMIFDFNFSARIGRAGHTEARSDIKGVVFTMYEIITLNKARQDLRHEEQDISTVLNLDWTQHSNVQLDHPISEFRRVVDEWLAQREAGPQYKSHKEAPNFLDWPPLPDPPLTERTSYYDTVLSAAMMKLYDWRRTELLELGDEEEWILNWQRPAQQWPELA